VGIYPVPLPAGYSSVSSSCLYCCVWGGLSAFQQFVEFSVLWNFLTVGGVVQVACQGFLVREACVGVLVGGAESLFLFLIPPLILLATSVSVLPLLFCV